MTLKQAARTVRDHIYRAVYSDNLTEIQGVKLLLKHPAISARMFHVLTHNYEVEEIRLADKWIAPGDKVLEIGVAIGFVALHCIKNLGVSEYALIEANPDLVDLLTINFALNGLGLSDFNFHNVALGAQDGELEFGVNRNFWSSSTVTRSNESKRVRVRARSIPSLLSDLPFKPNTLIMDIEGGEAVIPPEHFATFEKVIIETHARAVGEEAIDRLITGLTACGFKPCALMDTTYVMVKS